MQLFVSLLGLLVSLLVLINIRSTNKANSYLVVFLILINLFNVLNYSTMFSNNKYMVAIFMVHFMPLIALTGPSLYLYIRSLLSDDASLHKRDLVHLIPFLLFFINNLKFNFFISFEQKLAIAQQMILHDRSLMLHFDPLIFSGEIAYFIRSASTIAYMIACTIIVYQHFKEDIRTQIQNVIIFRWLVLLLVFNYVMNFSIFYYTAKLLYYWRQADKLTVLPFGIFIFGVGSLTIINLILFLFPSILYGLPRMDYFVIKPNEEDLLVVDNETKKVVKEFEISNEKLSIIGTKVENYCIDKPYLNPSFSLVIMSEEIGIPMHHLSYFFNEHLEIDFSSWKNNARISYVVELINAGDNQYYTLDALSRKAGYVSRSTFIKAFKQKMGTTPTEYINSL